MERLTIPDIRVDEHTIRRTIIDGNAVREHAMEFYWRLKAIEDILGEEYDLDHLRELMQAEKGGLLVVMPCKTVYVPIWDAGEKCDLACPVSIDGKGYCDLCDKAEQFIYEEPCRQEHIEQIGKTVFLTHEEAEAALAGGNHGKENP